MTLEKPFNADAHIDLMAPVVGVPIDPAYRAGVVRFLKTAHQMADQVMGFPLPDTIEPAPVFVPMLSANQQSER